MEKSEAKLLVDIYCKLVDVEVVSCANSEVGFYSCYLTFTDVSSNSNKYYIIQILELCRLITQGENRYALYTRYGRTGDTKPVTSCTWNNSLNVLCTQFKKKYREKTQNTWGVTPFVPKTGKYFLLETVTVSPQKKELVFTESKLDDQVQNVVKLICSTNIHKDKLSKFNFDIKKMPLGAISDKIIKEAVEILVEIETSGFIGNFDNDNEAKRNILLASNEFWTRVPYSCKRSQTPPILKDNATIARCYELLELMRSSKIAHKMTDNITIDSIYDELNIKIEPCKGSDIDMITKFVLETKSTFHNYYQLDIVNIFRVERSDTDDSNFNAVKNHMLLVHGSPLTNIAGILKDGLRIPMTDNQISNGIILGKGIYFADSISKSFNYCNAYKTDNTGFVFLCEVALGENIEDCPTMVDHHDIVMAPEFTARKGLGKNILSSELYTSDDGFLRNVKIPRGPFVVRTNYNINSTFLHDEYVVFDVDRYRFRYIIQLKI